MKQIGDVPAQPLERLTQNDSKNPMDSCKKRVCCMTTVFAVVYYVPMPFCSFLLWHVVKVEYDIVTLNHEKRISWT